MNLKALLGLAAITGVVLLYVAFLAWRALGVELSERRIAEAAAPGAALPDLRANALPSVPPVTKEFIERPLFWPERRPPESKAPASVKTPVAAPTDLKITGAVNSGDHWFALGQFKGKPVRLSDGEEIGGWTVARIEANRVTLKSDQDELVWEIFRELTAPPAAGQPAASKAKSLSAAEERVPAIP